MTTMVDLATQRRRELSDALLQVAHGDRAAMRLVYDRSSAKLFGVCLRICQDRDIAADIMQDAYIKVWNRAGRFDPERASPITWLATIARNTALDWARANRPKTVEIGEAGDIADDAPSAPDTIAQDQEQARIEHCLEELGGTPAQAIRRAFFDGLTYAQVAERMSVPLGTMKSWIRRGLSQLRTCLADG